MSATTHPRVFILEDDEFYRELLQYNLNLNPDYEVKSFATAADLLAALHDKPHIVTLDYRLPDMDGVAVLKRIKDFNPDIEVVVISEQDKIETAVELLNLGAYDYIVKERQIKERLHHVVNHILQNVDLQQTLSLIHISEPTRP